MILDQERKMPMQKPQKEMTAVSVGAETRSCVPETNFVVTSLADKNVKSKHYFLSSVDKVSAVTAKTRCPLLSKLPRCRGWRKRIACVAPVWPRVSLWTENHICTPSEGKEAHDRRVAGKIALFREASIASGYTPDAACSGRCPGPQGKRQKRGRK